jgi:hypothetical protein
MTTLDHLDARPSVPVAFAVTGDDGRPRTLVLSLTEAGITAEVRDAGTVVGTATFTAQHLAELCRTPAPAGEGQ